MNVISKVLKLSKLEYYEKHLSILNLIIPVKMTPKEIEVLAKFMSFEGELENDRFGTTARKLVKEEVGLSSGGLGNYLKSLKEKKFIKDDDTILSILFPNKEQQLYQFQFINLDNYES